MSEGKTKGLLYTLIQNGNDANLYIHCSRTIFLLSLSLLFSFIISSGLHTSQSIVNPPELCHWQLAEGYSHFHRGFPSVPGFADHLSRPFSLTIMVPCSDDELGLWRSGYIIFDTSLLVCRVFS